jgi:hypothetical protein
MGFCGQIINGVSLAGPEHPCCSPLPKEPAGCCNDQQLVSTIQDVKLTPAQLKLPVLIAVPAPPVLRLVYRPPTPTCPADKPAASP